MASNAASKSTFHMSPEEFRKQGYAVVDWIADYSRRIESFPVLSQVKPGEIRAKLPRAAPAQPEAFDKISSSMPSAFITRTGSVTWQSGYPS